MWWVQPGSLCQICLSCQSNHPQNSCYRNQIDLPRNDKAAFWWSLDFECYNVDRQFNNCIYIADHKFHQQTSPLKTHSNTTNLPLTISNKLLLTNHYTTLTHNLVLNHLPHSPCLKNFICNCKYHISTHTQGHLWSYLH